MQCSEKHYTENCPSFIALNVEERINIIKDKGACWACMRIGHKSSYCWRRRRCTKDNCNMFHHELLHSQEDSKVEIEANHMDERGGGSCLLQLMKIKTECNNEVNVLWDGGATLSLITFKRAAQLGLTGKSVRLSVTKVGGITDKIDSYKYQLYLIDKAGKNVCFILYGIDKISSDVKNVNITGVLKDFENIQLNEVKRPKGEIDILIGFDYAGYHPIKVQSNGHLLVMQNQFGMCLSGYHSNLFEETVRIIQHAVVHHTKGVNIDDFHDIEGLGIMCTPKCGSCRCGGCAPGTRNITLKEERELLMIENGLERQPGFWKASYPWIRSPDSLEDNRHVAEAMLKSTEKRLLKDKDLSETYQSQIKDMLERGVAMKLSEEDFKAHKGPVQYISHHEVMKKDSISTPCRIVFNASAKYKGICLNDCWAKGPNVMNNMLGVLIRFREGKIALAGDIRKMYHSVHLSETDQHMHRFLWRNLDINAKIETYIFTRVCFGDKPAGTIATVALRKTADEYSMKYPRASDTIKNNTYVDDILDSVDEYSLYNMLKVQIKEILQSGNFSIKEWISNVSELESYPVCNDEQEGGDAKVLGMRWNPKRDNFEFKININFSPKKRKVRTGPNLSIECFLKNKFSLTKRIILSQINGIFDPLGLLVPFTIKAKIMMQNFWKNSLKPLSWDDILPDEVTSEWCQFFKDLYEVEKITFHRCVKPQNAKGQPSLIIFSDASEEAYGACAYVRWPIGDDSFESSLLCAKGRVAPLKKISIVRLELCGAVIAKRLYCFINEECRFRFENVHFIVDSKIVQAMIHKESYGFKTYASVRIGEIQFATPKQCWAWIEGENNIADWITRPKTPEELSENGEWQVGPGWLKLPEDQWPINSKPSNIELPETLEVVTALNVIKKEEKIMNVIDITRFSSYIKLLHVTARILSVFMNKTSFSLFNMCLDINISVLKKAEDYWIRDAQYKYLDRINSNELKRLSAKINDRGIIIVGQRIELWMKDSYNPAEIIFLPYEHRLSYLYALFIHNQAHLGIAATTCKVRLKFWIVKLGKILRSIRYNCIDCRKMAEKCEEQMMGLLPNARLNPAPAWTNTTLDLFGPFVTRGEVNKRSRGKAYGLILTCAASRAVHVDLLVDYSTDGFLQGFRRFMALRGSPSNVYSDPGSQLHGAKRMLKEFIKNLDESRLKDFGVKNEFEWHFNSGDAPWQNGCSESLIPSVKKAIKCAIGEQVLSFSELLTVMYEAANLVNERPIGKTNMDIDDGSYLCPNDLLLGRATSKIQAGPFDTKANAIKRFQFVQKIVDAFWIKWTRYYFPSLIIRGKWHTERRNLCVGDIVLIQDSNNVRGQWKQGRVSKVYPGLDGKVRKVQVEYKDPGKDSKQFTRIERPVQRLILLLPHDVEL